MVLAESGRDPDLAAFAGDAHLGRSLLVLPRGGEAHLGYFTAMERGEAAATGLPLLDPAVLGVEALRDAGADDAALLAGATARALARCAVEPGRLAVAGHGAAGTLLAAAAELAAAGWELIAGDEPVLLRRKTKSASELAGVTAAAAGAVAALRRVAGLLAAAAPADDGGDLWLGGERLTVGRLRAEVAMELAGRGLEQPHGNILAPGGDAALPHSTGDDGRVLGRGEALVVDLFPRAALYADLTRTLCHGEPPAALRAAHAAVVEALTGAARAAVAGARGWDLQLAACGVLGGHGYPTPISHPGTLTGYVHNLGHGVGFELHELPSFCKQSGADGVLEPGDVFTLEPGLYDPGAGWGVRVEDLYHLTAEGPQRLTDLPYDLDPRAY